jgi:uncharacterized heparinase superfamily protein
LNDLSPDPLSPSSSSPDGIEEGRRLIRLGVGHGLSLAERFADRVSQLTWRTPLHSLRLKGRYPQKLLAVPVDPIPGVAARGEALLEGRITYRGDSVPLLTLEPGRTPMGKPLGTYFQSFAWLRDLAAAAPRAQAARVAELLMAKWLDAHADTVSGDAWAPEAWGRRMLFWCAYSPLILSSHDLVYRSSVLNALGRGARHLDRGADKAAPGAARIAAWCGIVAGCLLLPGSEGRRGWGETGLARALAVSQFDDGGSVSRSPSQLLDSISLLAMVRSVYAARRLEMPSDLQGTLARMVAAVLGVTHADRGLSSWQGGGPFSAARVAAVIEASGVRTRPLRQSRDWGYQRLASGSSVLMMDAAPPPVSRVVEGGCASTLAFEFSDGADRLVVNCGGARAASARLPAALVEGLRTTAAHSTLTLADSNSTAIHADGTLGRGVGEVELSRQESDIGSRIEASHDGYVRRLGFVHRRQLMLTGDGRELRGEDALLPSGRRRRGSAFAIRFHLGRGVEASLTADGQGALLRMPSGGAWQFRCRGAALATDGSVWIDAEGQPVSTEQLVLTGDAAAGGASINWAFKRVG